MSNALNDPELVGWARQQPLAYEMVEGHLTLSAEPQQAQSRLNALARIASEVFSHAGQVSAWLITPSSEFGGLSPADLATSSEEGSQLVSRALIRQHRASLETADG